MIAEHSTFTARLRAAREAPAAYKRMRYRQGLIARLYATADALLAVSSGVADDLSQTANVPRESIHVIHNPVVTDELREKAKLEPSHPWCLDTGLDVILAAGRLAPEKGFDQLVDAFARLAESRPALRLLIVGEGPERCVLASKIADLSLEDRVALPGWVDNPYALMSHSRVFVLSSLFEGLPVALIEALACGCKVVANDCPSGPREILDDGRYGELVSVGDESALAEAIAAELVRDRSRAALIERGSDFAAGPAVASYRTLIDDLMRPDARITLG
ncbi:glycosyl transferase group 1 protein [Salinisphaera sp. T31B1]